MNAATCGECETPGYRSPHPGYGCCLREVELGTTFPALRALNDYGSMPNMSDKYAWPPYSFYAPPGVVKVSASALRMARELAETVLVTRPGFPQVIVFSWRDSGWVRKP